MRYAFIVIVLMALSFGGGFYYEYTRTAAVQPQLKTKTVQLSQANSTLDLCRIQDQLVTLFEQTRNRNYGDASAFSTQFFNDVNNELPRASQPKVKSALQSILSQRDTVIAQLAKGDPASHDSFSGMLVTFHQALDSAVFQPATTAP